MTKNLLINCALKVLYNNEILSSSETFLQIIDFHPKKKKEWYRRHE
jgi:hypothetical protein